MSIIYKEIDTDGFKANTAILICDKTGLKMAEIIIRPSDKMNKVSAYWIDSRVADSGEHHVSGSLSIGPIDTHSQKTSIVDTKISKNNEGFIQAIIVKRIK